MEVRITEVLLRNFAGAEVDLECDSETEKISGRMLWDGFTGRSLQWRQNAMYRVLQRELGPVTQMISHIFTLTPVEFDKRANVA